MRSRLTSFLLTAALIIGLAPAAEAADIRTIDIAQITWQGAKAPSVSTQDIVTAIENKVTPNWSSFTTIEGDSRDKTITFKYGRTLTTPIRLVAPLDCEKSDFAGFLNSIRNEAYEQLALSDWKERYLVILAPDNDCIWSGRAAVGDTESKGGVMILHDNASGFVITHELGHSLGLGHSNLLRCTNAAVDGPWSRTCRAVEYGGSIDVMGNVDTSSPLSTYHQWRLGLVEAKEVKQSWLNEKIELSASDVYGGFRALFIRDAKSTYWIEYRRPKLENSYKPGLVIFRTDPPSPTFVESPNPQDSFSFEPGLGVSGDVWMLNLDNYQYTATGKSSGSMTLAAGKSVTLFSGDIKIEAQQGADDKKISVTINRKVDSTPPPVPPVTPFANWRYPGAEILQSGYDDAESAIAEFEAQIDGKIVSLEESSASAFAPTYLDPFITRKTLFVKDLPEGTYSLSIRATDMWGNKSAWSPATKVTIDRGLPIVKNDALVVGATSDALLVSLSALKDAGSDLCSTQIINDDGFVLQSSLAKSAPEFKFKKTGEFKATLHTFDCLGNGVAGDLSLKSSYIAASKASRSGKWSPAPSSLGEGALTCTGKCSASFTVAGKVNLLVAEGDPSVIVSSKTVAKVPLSSARSLRTGAMIDIGPRSKRIRISGSNFTLIGLVPLELAITNQREMPRKPSATDPSLKEEIQKSMSRYGFGADDFSHDWIVLPMARGTTLEDPTLDLCSADFKSEVGRQYRRQLTVSKVGAPYLFLSSEVVKYKDKSAADAALSELKANYSACVKNKGGVERDGAFVDYIFASLPASDATLVAEGSRVIVRAQIGKGVTARQLLAFYQFKNEMFTGLYVVKAGDTAISEAEVKRWFDAASVLAQRLDIKF